MFVVRFIAAGLMLAGFISGVALAKSPTGSMPEGAQVAPMSKESMEKGKQVMEVLQRCMQGDDSSLDKKMVKQLKANRKEAVEAIEIVYKEKGPEVLLDFAGKVSRKLESERYDACGKAAGIFAGTHLPLGGTGKEPSL